MKINQTAIKQGIELKDIGCAIPFTFVNDEDQAAFREGVFMKVSVCQGLNGFCIFIANLITGELYGLDVDYESVDGISNDNPTFCDCDEVIPYPNSILNLQR